MTFPDHVVLITVGAAVVALLTAITTVYRPEVALTAVFGVLPLHRVIVAAVDHTFLPPPPSTDPLSPLFHFQQYFFVRLNVLDAAVLGGLVGGTAFRATAYRGPTRPFPPLIGVALVYLVVVGAIAVLSPIPLPALVALVLDTAGPLILLATWALQLGRRATRAALVALGLSTTLLVIGAGIEQGITSALRRWVEYTPPGPPFFTAGMPTYRSGALLGGPLEYSFFSAAVVSLALGALLAAGGQRRWPWVVGVAVAAAGLALTFTRSGYLGAATGLGVTLTLAARRRRGVAAGTAVALVATAVVVAASLARVSPLAHGNSNAAHLSRVRTDLSLIQQHPGGYGLGTIDIVAYVLGLHALHLNASEDVYLGKGVEGGLPLLIVDVVLTTSLIATLGRRARRAAASGDREAAALCAGAAGAATAVAVAGLFLAVQETAVLVATWGAAGLALAATDRCRPTSRPTWRRPPACLIGDAEPAAVAAMAAEAVSLGAT